MFRVVFTLGVILPMVAILLTTASFVTLAQLTEEVPIARVTFEKDHLDFYKRWKVHYLDLVTEGEFDGLLYGDQWRLDVRFLKMKPWANLFGVEPRYVIERIEGRYQSITEQNKQIHYAYDLDENEPFFFSDSWLDSNVFVDVEYGSSVYTSIRTDAVFTVYRTNTGLIVRSAKKSMQHDKSKAWWEIF